MKKLVGSHAAFSIRVRLDTFFIEASNASSATSPDAARERASSSSAPDMAMRRRSAEIGFFQ